MCDRINKGSWPARGLLVRVGICSCAPKVGCWNTSPQTVTTPQNTKKSQALFFLPRVFLYPHHKTLHSSTSEKLWVGWAGVKSVHFYVIIKDSKKAVSSCRHLTLWKWVTDEKHRIIQRGRQAVIYVMKLVQTICLILSRFFTISHTRLTISSPGARFTQGHLGCLVPPQTQPQRCLLGYKFWGKIEEFWPWHPREEREGEKVGEGGVCTGESDDTSAT